MHVCTGAFNGVCTYTHVQTLYTAGTHVFLCWAPGDGLLTMQNHKISKTNYHPLLGDVHSFPTGEGQHKEWHSHSISLLPETIFEWNRPTFCAWYRFTEQVQMLSCVETRKKAKSKAVIPFFIWDTNALTPSIDTTLCRTVLKLRNYNAFETNHGTGCVCEKTKNFLGQWAFKYHFRTSHML